MKINSQNHSALANSSQNWQLNKFLSWEVVSSQYTDKQKKCHHFSLLYLTSYMYLKSSRCLYEKLTCILTITWSAFTRVPTKSFAPLPAEFRSWIAKYFNVYVPHTNLGLLVKNLTLKENYKTFSVLQSTGIKISFLKKSFACLFLTWSVFTAEEYNKAWLHSRISRIGISVAH